MKPYKLILEKTVIQAYNFNAVCLAVDFNKGRKCEMREGDGG